MPLYRVHRLKEGPRENFRWAAHTSGLAVVKPKDYGVQEEVEARNPYDLWNRMRTASNPLRPGDLLQEFQLSDLEKCSSAGTLCIAKYIGFEPAQWVVPQSEISEVVLQSDLSGSANQDSEARPS